MKIAFIISTLYGGGAERVASILANQWISVGNKLCFFTTSFSDGRTYYLNSKIDVEKIAVSRRQCFLSKILHLKAKIKDYSPDVIVSFLDMPNFYASFVGGLLKIPTICSERNNPIDFPSKKSVRLLRRIAFSKANGVVFQTSDARSFFPRKVQKKGYVVSNPVTPFLPDRKKPTDYSIVSAGRLESQKDFPTLIKAFAQFYKIHPEYSLIIYGDGSQKQNLLALIQDNQLAQSIKIMPFSESLHQIIAESRIFVLASRFEGMPNTLLEALSIGVPSVASDCPIGGCKELISNAKYSALFEPGNVTQLNERLLEIAGDYEKHFSGSASEAQYFKERYSVAQIASEWLLIIKNTIDGKIRKLEKK
ncbi:MAG: glycosyltransferase [Bacilli bacterium]|nr:glycosyltransferase [Bacilli bacterium]